MSQHLHTETEIDAPPERVWNILTDFAAYPDWNPFIPQITGPITVGESLDVKLQPPGGRAMTMKPNIRAVSPQRELRWLGRLIAPGIFDGEHSFRIEPLAPNRVRFVQEEHFTGVLSSVIMRFIGDSTRRGFEAMNQALKLRAEATSTNTHDQGR